MTTAKTTTKTTAQTLSLEDEVRRLIEPLLDDFGVDLFDIVWGGGRLKVTVEAPGGITTTLLSKVSRTISHELDIHDPIQSRYTLEVSSPGLERQLRRPEHYIKSVGSAVTLKLKDGQTRLQGTITDADDKTITLKLSFSDDADSSDIEPSDTEPSDTQPSQSIAYADIARAQTVFTWPAPAAPKTPANTAAPKAPANSTRTAPKTDPKG